MDKEKTIEELWESSNNGTMREDIEAAFSAGAQSKIVPVDVWWDSVRDSIVCSGAISGMEWEDLWPEAQEDIVSLYRALSRGH